MGLYHRRHFDKAKRNERKRTAIVMMTMMKSGDRDPGRTDKCQYTGMKLTWQQKGHSQSINKPQQQNSSIIRKEVERSENYLSLLCTVASEECKMYLKKRTGEFGELEATWKHFSIPRSHQPAIWKVLQEEQFQSTKEPHALCSAVPA